MVEMEEICRKLSALSLVQIHILKNSEEVLQFASDLSHRELFLYAPGKDPATLVLVAHRMPLLQKDQQPETVSVGTIFQRQEEALAYQVWQSGRSLRGQREVEYGSMVPQIAYPFVDNAGSTIGVFSFVGPVEANREILTETAFLSLQVPMDDHTLYRPLSLQDGIMITNGNGVISYADDMAVTISHLCGQRGEVKGTSIYSMPLDFTGAKKTLATALGTSDEMTVGDSVISRRIIPVLQRGRVKQVISVLAERTELFHKEEELLVKTSVIREIHHRVKNNLQTIASLLRMQLRRCQSEEAKTALSESLNRILSISLVHEILSHHDEEQIDITDVAQRLLDLLVPSLVGNEIKIEIDFQGEPLFLSSDAATSLALVLNELITNALLHGFANRQAGQLSIHLQNGEKEGLIMVSDNGCGLKLPIPDGGRRHLGLAIVRTLMEKDLHGSIEFTSLMPHGTKIVLHFPLPKGAD